MILRQWFYDQLKVASTLPDAAILAGGALTGSPDADRFIVYRMQEPTPTFNNGDKPEVVTQLVQVWVYDRAGSYDWIDEEITSLVLGLSGQVDVASGIACRWVGNSSELSDDELNRIVRNSQFQLSGVLS